MHQKESSCLFCRKKELEKDFFLTKVCFYLCWIFWQFFVLHDLHSLRCLRGAFENTPVRPMAPSHRHVHTPLSPGYTTFQHGTW
ncbi:hypothetical protein AAFF_G00256630 [Aldrovandia affinis]|uniref:Uncharacterized protein n=1 Tax=Aldrovandia affinis TaxID=143900 RepID=A0AAD7SSV5_9TELE|nr:hypothetical protein AAFF_G00256630 [Aldrovandia affinis]